MSDLYKKVFGCLAGSNIGSAMGAQVEGWEVAQIQEKHGGLLKELLPYGGHYRNINKPGAGRDRAAGTTEDGIERQRLLCTAIIEKKGRITAQDLAEVWKRDINPANFGVQLEPCDEVLYDAVKAGLPVHMAGRFSDYPGIVSFARSCHPMGLINACDPEQAVLDTFEVGQIYQPTHGFGLDYAAAYSAAIAEAMKPDATVDSVIQVAIDVLPKGNLNQKPKDEVKWAISLADESKDVWEMRDKFYEKWNGRGLTYALSYSQEIVPKGFAIFYKTKGNCYDSIITAVNFGRDTDCAAAVAAGLAGAFEGDKNIPQEWVDTVDEATRLNEYTVSQRLLAPTAEGIVEALKNDMKKREAVNQQLGQLLG